MAHTAKQETITIRLTTELKSRVEALRISMPYPPSMTTIVERGLVLAVHELEKMKAAAEREG
jgi:hypothetical protein